MISQLSLVHRSWDTLQVDVNFASKTAIGGTRPAAADNRSIVAFNASYDTLYVGADSVFALPDADLGNEEQLLVEVCGDVKQLRVCEQVITTSSPKRVSIDPEITYPLRQKDFEGRYRLPFVVERMENEDWTPVKPTESVAGHLKAYVQGKEEGAIMLPFSEQRGEFNLARAGNYKDFKFYLDAALINADSVNVIFDVYVDMDGVADAVASVSRGIQVKSQQEHKQDVALYVERAADRLVDILSPFLRKKANTVYIDRWTHNKFKKMYSVEMEVEWRGALFNRSTYRVKGVLEAYENGEQATFRYVDGNRRGRQRWESRVRGEAVELYAENSSQDNIADLPSGSGPFRAENGMLVIEAEHFESSRSYNRQSWMTSRERSGYTGSGAVVVMPDRGVRIRSRYNKRSPELTYIANFEEGGTYYVWMRVYAKDRNSNSMHLGINGDAIRSSSYMGTEIYDRWIWTRKQLDSDDYATVRINSPGVKRINLWMREDGLFVDRIILTKDRYFAPKDAGPAESLR